MQSKTSFQLLFDLFQKHDFYLNMQTKEVGAYLYYFTEIKHVYWEKLNKKR